MKRDIRFSSLAYTSLSAVLLLACILGCAGKVTSKQSAGRDRPYKVDGKWYQPVSVAPGYRERGIASWYGGKFHGRRTASGETYNMHAMTAAHKTLPLGTLVTVRNLDNREQTQVRINDRGPFIRGRIIDLSYKAAKRIGIVGPGTAEVEIRVIGSTRSIGGTVGKERHTPSTDFTEGSFTFQIGAYRSRENAEKQRRLLAKRYHHVHIAPHDTGDGKVYRVRVGRFSDLEQARQQEARLIGDGYTDIFIVAEE